MCLVTYCSEKALGQYQANRVNRFVPAQSFLYESEQNRLDRIRLAEGDLVLHYGMHNSMQVFVWEPIPSR